MFLEIKSRWPWRPLPNCPGRFVLSGGPTRLRPDEVVARAVHVDEYAVATAPDPVLVVVFEDHDGGLLSYRKPDGTYVHTLNSHDGLVRKLHQLGIPGQQP